MATCKECIHFEGCSGFLPTDMDEAVWDYCRRGIPEEIPDIDERCDSFMDRKSWVEVVRCKDCKHYDNSEGICWCHLNSKFFPGGLDWHGFPEDGFCSYGERKDNETDRC